MTLEREFKVGDRVCSFRGKKGVVVGLNKPAFPELNIVFVKWDGDIETGISESQVWHEGATPKFDYMAHQAKLEHEQKLILAEERRKVERAFDAELENYPRRTKYHLNDRVFYPIYGCGTVIKASPHIVTVKFANDDERSLATYPPLRFATEVDEQFDPNAVLPMPEPLDETATLDDLVREVSSWTDIVQFLDGDDDDDEIRHDLYERECIHGSLNGLKKQGITVPQALLQALEDADQHFIENSVNYSAGKNTPLEDDVFWYRSRWPKSKSKQGN